MIDFQIKNNDDYFGEAKNIKIPNDLEVICKAEIFKLNSIIIATSPKVSLLDFLYLNKKKIERYIANDNVCQVMNYCNHNFELKFPVYGSLLNYRFFSAKKFKRII